MQNLNAIDDFLNDISSTAPEGKDLKYSSIYDSVREFQREDYDLPQGVWVQDVKSADWRQVENVCVDALKNKSKDLQVCAWLIEAWMHLYNLKGLKAGLDLMYKLSEKYWDNGYPKLEEGDVEFRLAPYLWLNQKMSERVNNIRATQPNDPELHVHTIASYIDIQHFIGHKKEDTKSMPKDKLETLESFEKSLEKTDTAFFKELIEDANTVVEMASKIEDLLDEKLGKDATSLYNLKNKVTEIGRFSKQILSYRGADVDQKDPVEGDKPAEGTEKPDSKEPESQSEKTSKGGGNLSGDGKNIDISSVIRSRAHAYQIIREAAEFLEELDPHSPAPHLIKRAANWGRLSFPDLMRELVQDPSMQGEIYRLLGFQQEGHGGQQPARSLPPQQPGRQQPSPQQSGGGQKRPPSHRTVPDGWPFDDDFR